MDWRLQPKHTDWLRGYKNKTPKYTIHKRPTSDLQVCTNWKWGGGKNTPGKWKSKESCSNNTHIRYNRLYSKDCYKKQRRALHNDQRSIQEDITVLNIYVPNTGAPQHISQILTIKRGEINSSMIIVGQFNPHFYQWTVWTDKISIRKLRP